MERYAWKAQVLDGQLEEYKRRHAALWPELKAVLKEAGISNYTIWNVGNDLFGYTSVKKGWNTLPACRPAARWWIAGTRI